MYAKKATETKFVTDRYDDNIFRRFLNYAIQIENWPSLI